MVNIKNPEFFHLSENSGSHSLIVDKTNLREFTQRQLRVFVDH